MLETRRSLLVVGCLLAVCSVPALAQQASGVLGFPGAMGARNVLLVMTDDNGFRAPSTFDGVIPTQALDRIAAKGLRYANFHSTLLCSPTRAAIITGRNSSLGGLRRGLLWRRRLLFSVAVRMVHLKMPKERVCRLRFEAPISSKAFESVVTKVEQEVAS